MVFWGKKNISSCRWTSIQSIKLHCIKRWISFIREPKRIVHPMPKFFYGITLKSSVSKISVGCKHTVCNTLNGMGFVWGENTEGKLGLGESTTGYVSKPTLLNIKEFQFESTFFVTCSAGESHTCLVDTNGIVYASGYGEGGRLGNNTCRNQNMFQKMSFRTRNCFSLSHDETKTVFYTYLLQK